VADVVVCADVMEHIEPECLDDVILHIRALAKQYAIFVIATQPSKKIMDDGRTAHLIVEGSGFWFAKLSSLFEFERFEDRTHEGRGLLIVCKPTALPHDILLPVARIRAGSAVDDELRNKKVRTNSARLSKRLEINIKPHDRVANLVCYGPSLKNTWPSLMLAKAAGQDIFSVSGSHDFLIEHGITPTAHMDCDPRPHKVQMLSAPNHGVKYWLASCVDPSYLDKLDGYDVSLWHSYNGVKSKEAFEIDPGHRMIIGGGSIGLRAMSVLYCRGYRKFEIHGMDCCFLNSEHHAGDHKGKNHDAVPVKCGDRWFQANAVMILYARYFPKQIALMPDAAINLHGDGLLQHMTKLGA
jgi:hypothetical protein